jgi:alpha-L-fucosidase
MQTSLHGQDRAHRFATFAALLMLAAALPPVSAQQMTAQRHQAKLEKLLGVMQQTIAQGPYESTRESLERYDAPEWYADAKLGIFIHYGLFSVPGYSGVGCWYGNNMYDPKNPAWIFHRENFGPQDKFGYKDFVPYLTANEFNAEQWVRLFKEAGARFVVPVSCFHDGFAMWDSKLTDWNAVKMGPKRDYDGLLAAAARKQGLKFGVAWHAFYRPEFFGPGRRTGTDIHPPEAGPPWSFYGPAGGRPLSREFIDDSLGRLVELVDGYRPDLVWFDFDTGCVPAEDLRRFAAFYFNKAAQWKKAVAINDKHEDLFPRCIVLDFERGKTAGLRPDLWQTDTSVSWRDWSYMRNDSFKTVDELVRELVDIVSKNGVLLLDIGPRPDGSIPPEPQALLQGIGAWLKVNGDAIYGTRPCWALGFGEGTHNSGGGGFSDRAVQYNPHDFRFTQKGNLVYAIAMDWPDADDHFLIRAFTSRTVLASGGLASVKLLGAPAPLDWKLTDNGLWIRRPARRPCDGAFAFQLILRGVSVEKLAAERLNDRELRVEIRLRNLDAKPARLALTFYDHQNALRTESVSLPASETVTRSFVMEAPLRPAGECITVGVAGGNRFALEAALFNPPNPDVSWHFTGDSMLAGGGLGKFDTFTLSLWTLTDDLRETWTALLNTAGWDRGGIHVQFQGAGNLQVSLNNAARAGVDGHSLSTPGRTKGWHLLTVTYNVAARRARMFIDGKPDGELQVPGAVPADLDAFTLGGWTSGGRRFMGRMADVRLFNRILEPAELQLLLEGKTVAEGLVAGWDFAAPGGNTIPDTTGHGHDLRIER